MQAEQGDEKGLQFLDDASWASKESCRIILRWRKIFCQITIALIFPLCIIVLSQEYLLSCLLRWLLPGEDNTRRLKEVFLLFGVLSVEIRHGWIICWLFKAVYLIFTLAFSLLSTSAVVYTVACVYTGKETAFREVMTVVPKVWKRLSVTLLLGYGAMFIYNLITLVITILFIVIVAHWSHRLLIPVYVVISILYWLGYIYITMIWQLACVVSVLECVNGRNAMIKSKALLEGKTGTAWMNLYVPVLVIALLRELFDYFAVYGTNLPSQARIAGGISCFLALVMDVLIGLVLQTVIYFVCKSYHHEIIDKSTLAGLLEDYVGHYVPLVATKCVELQQLQV